MKTGHFIIGFICGIGVWISAFFGALGIGVVIFNSFTAVSISLVLILLIIAGVLHRKIGESAIYMGMLASVAIAIILSAVCGMMVQGPMMH
jgi:hypothetical protein